MQLHVFAFVYVVSFVSVVGRVQVDLYHQIQRDHKLSSYKLNAVALHFLRGTASRQAPRHRRHRRHQGGRPL